MYELVKVTDRCYYIDCPSKIGIYKISDSCVALIDSGNSRETGKKICKILEEQGWELRAIYNTHCHADHIGANKYLQNLTGCKIYAHGIERDFANHPILESSHIYGAFSPRDLRHNFLLAEECFAENLTKDALPEGLELIELPGHSFDMVGFRSSDGAFFIGDSILSKEALDKYGITFVHDVDAHIETLERLKTTEAKVFIPSHAAACEDITALADCNINKVREVEEKILSFCNTPISFENLLKKLFDAYSKKMNFDQYALVGCTTRSYLAALKNSGKLDVGYDGNIMTWKRV